MLAVNLKDPVLGSNNSAVVNTASLASTPPAIKTFPPSSSVAVCSARAVFMFPVLANIPVAGSNISADVTDPPVAPNPPVISTRPSASSVAVCCDRAAAMLAVVVNIPVAASNISAEASAPSLLSKPPATSTLPFASSTAVWKTLAAGHRTSLLEARSRSRLRDLNRELLRSRALPVFILHHYAEKKCPAAGRGSRKRPAPAQHDPRRHIARTPS